MYRHNKVKRGKERGTARGKPRGEEAKGKVIAARGVVNGLRGKFEASMRQNADWQAAKKALDDARASARAK